MTGAETGRRNWNCRGPKLGESALSRSPCEWIITPMTRITQAEAKKTFPEMVRRVARGRKPVIVTEKGKDMVAVISVRALNRLLEEQQDREEVKEAKRRLADPNENRIPFDQIRAILASPARPHKNQPDQASPIWGARSPNQTAESDRRRQNIR